MKYKSYYVYYVYLAPRSAQNISPPVILGGEMGAKIFKFKKSLLCISYHKMFYQSNNITQNNWRLVPKLINNQWEPPLNLIKRKTKSH